MNTLKSFTGKVGTFLSSWDNVPVRQTITLLHVPDSPMELNYNHTVELWDSGWKSYQEEYGLKLSKGDIGGDFEQSEDVKKLFYGDANDHFAIEYLHSWEQASLEESFETTAVLKAVQSR
jgi:hypothetical protein